MLVVALEKPLSPASGKILWLINRGDKSVRRKLYQLSEVGGTHKQNKRQNAAYCSFKWNILPANNASLLALLLFVDVSSTVTGVQRQNIFFLCI